jgi:hypothetical protein
VAREVVVDCDFDPLSVFAEFEAVEAVFVVLFGDEQTVY